MFPGRAQGTQPQLARSVQASEAHQHFETLNGSSRQPGLAVGGDGDRRIPEEQRPGKGNQMGG